MDFEIYYFYISSAGERGFMMENKMEERNWKYKITSSWTAVIAVAITTVVSGGFTFWLYTAHDGAFVGLGGLTAFFAIICVLSAYGAMSYSPCSP